MIARINVRFGATAATLLIAMAFSPAAGAAPRAPDCQDCSSAVRYDRGQSGPTVSEPQQPADDQNTSEPQPEQRSYDDRSPDRRGYPTPSQDQRSYQDQPPPDRPGYSDQPPPPRSYNQSSDRRRYDDRQPAPRYEDKRAGETPANDCADCPPPRKYDSQEVIKHVRDVDKSAVINTTTVVPVAPRIRETNHLVVHENQTRLTGTVQHNNLIIEKEIRYVKRRPPEVRYVKPRVVTQPVYVLVPVQPSGCGGCGRGGLLQALAPQPVPMMMPVAPVQQQMVVVPQVAAPQVVVPGCGGGYYSSCGMVLR